MPVTGPEIARRWLPLLVMLAAPLAVPVGADDTPAAADTVKQAATALGNGDAAGFLAAFAPSMPGLPALRTAVTELAQYGDVQSTIQFGSESGDNRARTLQMDWELRIAGREGAMAVTHRRAAVTCRVDLRNGQWHIAAFEPRDFFRSPHVEGAWNILQSAAAALNNGNAEGFLSYFAPSMPGFEDLRSGVVALLALGEVQSSIDLISNEGTDTRRAIEVDWTIEIVSDDTTVSRAARQQRVKCRIELQDKHWRITKLDPTGFFRAILLG